jgi:hypothetical protein
MSDYNSVVSIRKWALALVGGVPTIATLTLAFELGQTRANFESRIFDSPEQRTEIIQKVTDSNRHWSYEQLDRRYMPKNEVIIYLNQITKNQEKIMNELNIK